jgi:predicted Fe-S protein YdhL (DUF1289 family)
VQPEHKLAQNAGMNAQTAAAFDALLLSHLVEDAARVPTCMNAVPSPCLSICVMDKATGWCTGCLRNINEIAAWGGLGDEPKRRVWAQLERRAQQILRAKEAA